MSDILKKIILILLGLTPNAYLLKSKFYELPDLTVLIYVALYGVMAFSILIQKQQQPLRIGYADIFIALWIMVGAFSLLYSPYPSVGLVKLLKLCLMGFVIVYVIKRYVTSKEDWDFLTKSFVNTSFLIQLLIISAFIQAGMPFARFSFYDAHPIPLGMLGAITAVLVMMQLITKKISLLKFIIVFPISLWIVFISSSKRPLMALVLAFVLLLPTILNSLKKSVVFIFLGGVTFYFLTKTQQYEMMLYRILYTTQDQSTYIRLGLYDAALDEFRKNPFGGGGMGVFYDYYPHNIIFEVIAEGGVLFGALLTCFFVWIFYRYTLYLTKFRKNSYFYEPLIISIMSIAVLMVSFTYVDLKFLYLGVGGMLIFNRLNINEDASMERPKKIKKGIFKKYRIVW